MKRRHLLQALPAGLLAHPAPAAPAPSLWLQCGKQVHGLDAERLQALQTHPLPWRPELPPQRLGATLWLARPDGQLLALDLHSGAQRPLQLGAGLRHLQLSADGAWLLAAGDQALHLIDSASLSERARHASEPGLLAPLALAPRRSLLLAPRARPELWELYLDPAAEDFYEGLVHDYRFGEGVPTRGHLGRRRMALAAPAQALWQHPDHFHVALLQAPQQLLMFNLDARRPAGSLRLDGPPAGACAWQWQGRPVLALAQGPHLSLVDFERAELRHQQAFGPAALTGLWATGAGLVLQQGQRLLRLDLGLQTVAAAQCPPLDALVDGGERLWARSGRHWFGLDARDLRARSQRGCDEPLSWLLG